MERIADKRGWVVVRFRFVAGRFQPGHSRVGGRPKGVRNKATRRIIRLLRPLYEKGGIVGKRKLKGLKERMAELLQDPEPAVRAKAEAFFFEQMYGKALQPVEHKGESVVRLVEIPADETPEQWLARMRAPEDATPAAGDSAEPPEELAALLPGGQGKTKPN